MPKFKVDLKIKAVDAAKFFKYFEERIYKAIRESAAEAAISAASRVPVWSGMAKGSFLANVKMTRLSRNYETSAAAIFGLIDSPQSINITALVRAFRKYYEKRKDGSSYLRTRSTLQYLKSGEIKNAAAGARRSTYVVKITERGFSFSFESRVHYYTDDVQKTPWPSESFDTFRNLLESAMQARKSEMVPKPEEYIVTLTGKDLKAKVLPILKYTQARIEKPAKDPKTEVERLKKLHRGYSKKYQQKLKSWKTKSSNLYKKLKANIKRKETLKAAKLFKAELSKSKSKEARKIIRKLETFLIKS